MHQKVRSLFISDVHLGTPDCQADHLLRLLSDTQAAEIYLVGDIVDLESLEERPFWQPAHTQVLMTLVSLAESGVRVVFIPGNHDAACRLFDGENWRGIEILRETDYVARDGARFRIRHGDELDTFGTGKSWLESIGGTLYGVSCRLNTWYNAARRRLSMSYSPWSVNVKQRLKAAMSYIHAFEEKALNEAEELLVDGYICGHIHFANIRSRDGLAYLNCGDWVEHCTAICECEGGGFELWRCADHPQRLAQLSRGWWNQHLPSAA